MRSSCEGSFRDFFASGRLPPKVFLIAAVGIVMIIMGSIVGGRNETRAEEEKIEELCAMMEGVGECRVAVTYSSEGDSVYAVAVLCRGAESAEVRARVTELVCSLYGIGANRVSVMKLSE